MTFTISSASARTFRNRIAAVYMAKIRQVTDILDEVDEGDDENYDGNDAFDVNPTAAQGIDVRQSPYLDTFHNHHAVRVTIDSGATGNDPS